MKTARWDEQSGLINASDAFPALSLILQLDTSSESKSFVSYCMGSLYQENGNVPCITDAGCIWVVDTSRLPTSQEYFFGNPNHGIFGAELLPRRFDPRPWRQPDWRWSSRLGIYHQKIRDSKPRSSGHFGEIRYLGVSWGSNLMSSSVPHQV